MSQQTFAIGSIVTVRSREWVVQSGSTPTRLRLRPLSGAEADEAVVIPALEPVPPVSASFAAPDPAKRGNAPRPSFCVMPCK